MDLSFFIKGIPKPQARPRVFNRGKFVSTYSPKSDWFHIVYCEALKQKDVLQKKGVDKFLGAIRLSLLFCMPIPKSISKKKRELLKYVNKKPDIDNLVKAVMDAINNVGLWCDDSQVVTICASKQYSDDVGCFVVIEDVKDNDVEDVKVV